MSPETAGNWREPWCIVTDMVVNLHWLLAYAARKGKRKVAAVEVAEGVTMPELV